MLPKISEVGKLWAEPELRFTPGGKAVCSIPLVFSKSKKTENGGWVDDGTFWVRGTVWDTQAENCAETLSKGDKVLVIGELCEREYEDKKTGEKRKSLDLKIFDIGPSLKFNPAKISRAERGSQQQGAQANDPWGSAPATDSDEEIPF
jgi:single-strand DNA-binding protein